MDSNINYDKDIYLKFLNDNDTKKNIEENKQRQLEIEMAKDDFKKKQQKELEEKYQKADDYKYFISRIWLEMYLKNYETVFGKFNYSKQELSNKQKCEELLTYFADTCGVTDIKDVYRGPASVSRGFHF